MSDAEPAGLTGGADGDGDGMFADIGHFETGAIPVDAVVKRGKAIRNRRRLVGGGALAAATALTIAVPVALAGGSGEGAKPTAGHAIVVERPYENAAQQIAFAGSIDGKAWSRTYVSHCSGKPPLGGAECLVRVPGADKSPVEMVMQDEWHKKGDFYSAQFGPDTDYVVITLDTGDQATVPGVAADDGYRVAYFELPRRSTIEKITAYGKDGREIAHTRPGTIMGVENVLRMALVWDRPDGGELDTSIPTVHVASGTTDGIAWNVDATEGVYDRCFMYKSGADVDVSMCPDFGVRVYPNNVYKPGRKDAFVIGEVDPKTTRVDVIYKDGTVQHLIPTRSHGRAFVGTYVPDGATVASVAPVTGTNG